MKSALWLNRNLIDLVFERRNKAYGAFDLRLHYERNMTRAILLSTGVFVIAWIMFGLWLNRDKNRVTTPEETGYVVTITDAQPVQPARVKPQPAAPQPAAPQTALVTPTVVDEEADILETEIPTRETLSTTAIGTENTQGTGEGTSIAVVAGGTGTETVSVPIDEPAATPAQLFEVDQKPMFPGGDEKMYEYLRKHLEYPTVARESKISGTVVVRFVVNVEGRVEQVEIMKSPSAIFNEEALEVIRNMPAWTPAKRKGKAVPTYYIIPLKFQLL